MKMEPGFVTSLKSDLTRFGSLVEQINSRGGLSDKQLVSLVARPSEWPQLELAGEDDVVRLDSDWKTDSLDGVKALLEQRVSFVILTGGNALGVSSALVSFSSGMSLLAFKLAQAHRMFTTLLIDPDHTPDISDHITGLTSVAMVGGVEQYQSFKLTPDNRLLLNENGRPELYPTGTGDLPAAMAEGAADALEKLGIKYVVINHVNNLGMPCNVEALTYHINSGKPVTCQVVRRDKSDIDGTLAWKDGMLQVVESFELDDALDITSAAWCNTGSYIIDISVLKMASERLQTYHRIRRSADNKIVVQYERLIKELTELFPTNFVEVNRATYYAPINTHEDLKEMEKRYFGSQT